ncbi:MAG: ABC transporter permease, partial [Elusimicrobia bacterium CG_4_10_14_0_8_um_filter_37_32]
KEFRFKRLIIGFVNTWLALPAVVIGLLVYIFLSRRGPTGILGFLYTPYAMIIAQAILATPIITALTLSALKNIAKDTKDIAYSLGAN